MRSGRDVTATSRVLWSGVYLEIQQCVQLVLNGGQSLNQLVRVHGAHHAFSPGDTQEHMHTNTHATHTQDSSDLQTEVCSCVRRSFESVTDTF